MNQLAVITARGGSKRIPRKNIKDFCGKPIMAYSIEAALKSGVFDTVMVSTDDREIAEIAEKYGAAVPFFRSEKTSNDFAVTSQVLAEVLEEYESRGQCFDRMCCIYPTAPFITAERLRTAMELLEEKQADSVLPVVRFSFPPQRGVVLEDGFLRFKWPEHRNTRSQDLESFYHDVGQFYCVNVESFREQQVLVMEKTVPLILSELEIQDIDTEEDWKLAELKYQMLKEKGYKGG
ncbi:MAG: pseudaminic acid cytidylyltransferase [Acetatifactor sp.]|nr:pseudaminic acid cytidylyltransferase [Acetatifactor sp.]